ncbi:hypothetical protein RUM43_005967 [Polyplax serrata]|uniref:Uncharacterized protein n=1 Tax=Polyplax serrata TaxID=468196 RepID=A0AAN8NS96_POLSC
MNFVVVLSWENRGRAAGTNEPVRLFLPGVLLALLCWNCLVAISADVPKQIRSIVIDAGSSGNRICAYTFTACPSDPTALTLAEEFNYDVEPGLSTFVNNPQKVERPLNRLLEQVKAKIPQNEWSSTSIMLLATAGLRLVPAKQSKKILEVAADTLRNSGFRCGPQPAAIISGTEEGLLSWFTINLILGTYYRNSPRLVAVLDVGGASAQVTFVPSSVTCYEEYTTHLRLWGHQYDVYSRSYLRLGLNEARKLILKCKKQNGETIFHSKCFPPQLKANWTFKGVNYEIHGAAGEGTAVDFSECEREVQEAVFKQVGNGKPPPLGQQTVYGISGLYYRACDSRVIPKKSLHGRATLQEMINKAKVVCAKEEPDKNFLCMDVTYLVVLLRDIYGISLSNKVNFAKFLRGHKVGWALGAVYLNVRNQMMNS